MIFVSGAYQFLKSRQSALGGGQKHHMNKKILQNMSKSPFHWALTLECRILMLIQNIRCYTLLYFTILYYTRLDYTILYYTILYYTILYYTILYYTILYYTILYYTILYDTIRYDTIPYDTRIHQTIIQ